MGLMYLSNLGERESLRPTVDIVVCAEKRFDKQL